MFTVPPALAHRSAEDHEVKCEEHAHDDSSAAIGCSLPANHGDECESHGVKLVTIIERRDLCRDAACPFTVKVPA